MDSIQDYESRINAALERISTAIDGRTTPSVDDSELDALRAENARLKAELETQTAEVQTLFDKLAKALAQGEDA